MNTIRVHLPGGGSVPDRSYAIACGAGILCTVGNALRSAGATRAVIMADAAVRDTHAAAVAASLTAARVEVKIAAVPAGEGSKSLAEAGRLWDQFAAWEVDRKTHVVGVGGGVTGDLAGFVAATFARGLPVWHVPTTLVAQVDSAIGGKTGINLPGGKNLVGVFWQPAGVISDIETLATLPDREYVSGLAEVAKYGMILDPKFFAWLEENAGFLIARDSASMAYAVARSAALKAEVVERDERETSGLRAALNYGHTFAHAYETEAGYGTLLHGEAVAIGMAMAARLAARLGRIPPEIVARQDRLLAALQLPTRPDATLRRAESLITVMRRDKKSLGGRLRFVLPARVGHVELVDDVPPELVADILENPAFSM